MIHQEDSDSEEIDEIMYTALINAVSKNPKHSEDLRQESLEERIKLIPLVTKHMRNQSLEEFGEPTKHFKIVENFKKGYHRRYNSTGRPDSREGSMGKQSNSHH